MRTWTTIDGDKIPFNELGDNHLANIIRMVQKLVDSFPAEQVYCGDSDYGEDFVESENRINANLLEKHIATLKALKREQENRTPRKDNL